MEEVEARIADLQEEIEEDKINDENVDDQFEMMIQSTLTVSFIQPLNQTLDKLFKLVFQSIREMMVEWTKEDQLFFNNLAKVEEEFYKVNEAIANGSGDMKTQIASIFETLRSVSNV